MMFNLLKAFTAGCKLGWILKPCWLVNVPMIVLAVVIEGGTGVHRRIVMLKAFIRIVRNPIKTSDRQTLISARE